MMALLPLVLLSLIIISFGSTWTDDDIISFDQDLGWKLYSASLREYDPCRNVQDCQRFGINKYYGPFDGTDKYFLERNFECVYVVYTNQTLLYCT